MPSLDVFNSDVFGVVSMSAAVNKVPYAPTRLGQMGLFTNKPGTTTSCFVEEQEGRLYLIQTSPRGSRRNVAGTPKRKARTFRIPHLELNKLVLADDVQNVRAFGSENEVQAVLPIVNERLSEMRASHELTWEYHRMGAIGGVILDADDTVIYDLFDEFGVTQSEVEFDLTVDEDSVKQTALSVLRLMKRALGGTVFTRVHALCGDEFFDALVSSPSAKAAYDRWQNGEFFRVQQASGLGFEYAGITWENYDGYFTEEKSFIPTGECRFFPVGVPELFVVPLAPADYMETVNTQALPFYSKQERLPFDKGVDIETQSNPLHLCTRPKCLIKGTQLGAGSASE